MALLRSSNNPPPPHQSLGDFARYVPLRLSPRERALLGVLESTLHVSEYTDNVDVSLRRGNKARRILDGILEACNISTGLAVASVQDSVRDEGVEGLAGGPGSAKKGVRGALSLSKSKAAKQAEKAARKQRKKDKKLAKQAAAKARQSSQTSSTASSSSHSSELNGFGPTHDSYKAATDEAQTAAPPLASSSSSASSLAARDPRDNAAFFQTLFEIGRRNKILNPTKMRSTYGKLMHLLQDAQSPTVAKSLGFSLHRELVMVGPYLEARGCVHLLEDERLVGATVHVAERDEVTNERVPREEVEAKVRRKRALEEELVRDYCSSAMKDGKDGAGGPPRKNGKKNSFASASTISEEDLRRCIDSLADAVAVVECNLSPVRRILKLLEENFDPETPEKGYSLELRGSGLNRTYSPYTSGASYGRFGFSAFNSGGGGATLSHSHPTQYTFVWQSLRLWCKVQQNMHKLWVCADEDLLSTTTSYQLWNTGQGLNRVQSCPRVGKVMRGLLSSTQHEAGSPWVGLSVVHLGDRDVPNALVFIDKYTQIPRFLSPIVDFVDAIPELCQDERIDAYVKREFGSERDLKMIVLADYFKHGFDGSGDDGGSCIDGRLTSSWNWTSRVAKKSYYHALMLSGFQGFDGDFK